MNFFIKFDILLIYVRFWLGDFCCSFLSILNFKKYIVNIGVILVIGAVIFLYKLKKFCNRKVFLNINKYFFLY